MPVGQSSDSLLVICLFTILVLVKYPSFIHCLNNDYTFHNAHPTGENSININEDAPRPGWVDPFDMLGETRYGSDSLVVQSDVENHILKNRFQKCETYLRRFINLFLRAVELKDSKSSIDDSPKLVKLEFLISSRELHELRKFGQNEDSGAKIESVSHILSNIFSQQPKTQNQNSIFDTILRWLKKSILKLAASPEWTVVSSVALMLLVTLWFVYRTHSFRLALFTILLTIFAAGFGFTWMRMYEEKEIERYANLVKHGNVPHHCSGQSMAWYEHMYYRMFGVDCLQFYKMRDMRPMVKISPTDVLAETFTSMIINPATNIGKAYGNFIGSVIEYVPWWLKPIAVPLSFFMPLLFVILLLAFLFNYRLSISVTGIHFIPCWSHNHPSVQNRQGDKYIEDFSRKENESVQNNSTFQSVFSDNKTPLILLNWLGLKKLISNAAMDKVVNEDNEIASNKENRNKNHDTEGTGEIIVLEELLTVQKQNANCKQRSRSIHNAGEGTRTSEGKEELEVIDCLHSASGDQCKTLIVDEETGLKDKKT